MFFRNNDGTLTNSSATLNVHTHQQEQEMYKLLDTLIFSNVRIRIELAKYVEGVRNATKELNKYRRFCTQKKKPKKHFQDGHPSIYTLNSEDPTFCAELTRASRRETRSSNAFRNT